MASESYIKSKLDEEWNDMKREWKTTDPSDRAGCCTALIVTFIFVILMFLTQWRLAVAVMGFIFVVLFFVFVYNILRIIFAEGYDGNSYDGNKT